MLKSEPKDKVIELIKLYKSMKLYLHLNRAFVKECVCMRELIPHTSVPSPSREPFLTGTITERRIQAVNAQGQLGALVAPALYSTLSTSP